MKRIGNMQSNSALGLVGEELAESWAGDCIDIEWVSIRTLSISNSLMEYK
jgi:hypothetical protein